MDSDLSHDELDLRSQVRLVAQMVKEGILEPHDTYKLLFILTEREGARHEKHSD